MASVSPIFAQPGDLCGVLIGYAVAGWAIFGGIRILIAGKIRITKTKFIKAPYAQILAVICILAGIWMFVTTATTGAFH